MFLNEIAGSYLERVEAKKKQIWRVEPLPTVSHDL